jgi:hypothetical protein
MTSFDIPLTGSISAGFTIGFMKDDDNSRVAQLRRYCYIHLIFSKYLDSNIRQAFNG